MIALFCGSRDWPTRDLRDWAREAVRQELRALDVRTTTVIHGAAPGTDSIAGWEAHLMGFRVKPFPADWDGLGTDAGPARNGVMRDVLVRALRAGGQVSAFAVHNDPGLGTGTADMVRKLSESGIVSKLLLTDRPRPDMEVAAAVLHDGSGRILLQHRDDFAPMFPGMHGLFGGSLEPGETPGQALRREIVEELELELEDPVPMGSHLFRFPGLTILSHVWTARLDRSPDELRKTLREGQGLGLFTAEDVLRAEVSPHDRYLLRTAFAALRAPIV